MPIYTTLAGTFGYGRPVQTTSTSAVSSIVPSYYTSASGYLMYQPGYNVTSMNFKHASSISSATQIRTYTGLTGAGWNIVHDKDLDSNIWYSMQNGSPCAIYRYVLAKGGTTVTVSTVFNYGNFGTVLGQAYIPACAWSTISSGGGLMTGGYQSSNVNIVEFLSSPKAAAAVSSYRVLYANEVYGVEFVPAKASGFSVNFGVAYTRAGKAMASWRVDLDTRSWTDRRDNIYSSGVTGPANGDGMIYYPPGKPIFWSDPDTATNRIAMNDTSTSNLYVWTITQSTVALNWTFLKLVPMANTGGYPYHMSQNTYNAIV